MVLGRNFQRPKIKRSPVGQPAGPWNYEGSLTVVALHKKAKSGKIYEVKDWNSNDKLIQKFSFLKMVVYLTYSSFPLELFNLSSGLRI
jgi:hypothetical protein